MAVLPVLRLWPLPTTWPLRGLKAGRSIAGVDWRLYLRRELPVITLTAALASRIWMSGRSTPLYRAPGFLQTGVRRTPISARQSLAGSCATSIQPEPAASDPGGSAGQLAPGAGSTCLCEHSRSSQALRSAPWQGLFRTGWRTAPEARRPASHRHGVSRRRPWCSSILTRTAAKSSGRSAWAYGCLL